MDGNIYDMILKDKNNKVWEQELYDKYPKLFRQKDLPMTDTCMCWGICCGEGWKNIIDDACSKLSALAETENAIIEFSQVKEKFGGLRLYLDIVQRGEHKEKQVVIDFISPSGEINTLEKVPNGSVWDKAHEITLQAEELSFKTCDRCGQPGEQYNDGWIVTRCEKHAK